MEKEKTNQHKLPPPVKEGKTTLPDGHNFKKDKEVLLKHTKYKNLAKVMRDVREQAKLIRKKNEKLTKKTDIRKRNRVNIARCPTFKLLFQNEEPFLLLLFGSAKSGKTYFIESYLARKSTQKHFKDNIYIISGNRFTLQHYYDVLKQLKIFKNEDEIEDHLINASRGNGLSIFLATLAQLSKKTKRLIIMDDVASTQIGKNNDISKALYASFRHGKNTIIKTCNQFTDAPTMARQNCQLYIVFHMNDNEFKQIIRNLRPLGWTAPYFKQILLANISKKIEKNKPRSFPIVNISPGVPNEEIVRKLVI